MFDHTFKVHSSNLETFQKMINKRIRTTSKLGLKPIKVDELYSIELFKVVKKSGDTFIQPSKYYVYRVTGDDIKFAGWTFVAKMEFDSGKEFAKILSVPGQEVPEEYFSKSTKVCEHCKKIRKRNLTYLLKHESGEYKVVGSTCLKDFLGHSDLSEILWWMEFSTVVSGFEESSDGRAHTFLDVVIEKEEFTSTAKEIISKMGFISKSTANSEIGKESTSDLTTFLYMLRYGYCNKKEEYFSFGETLILRTFRNMKQVDSTTQKSFFEKVAKFAENKFSENKNNPYFQNINNIFNHSSYWKPADFGFILSFIKMFLAEEDNKKNTTETKKKSIWIGKVKERKVFELEINTLRDVESFYGASSLYSCSDKEGNRISFFSNTQFGEIGETIKIKGTITKHEKYFNQNFTVLNRVVKV